MRISDWSSDVCSSDLKQAKLLPNDGEDIVGVRFGQMELGHTAARTNTQQATAGQSRAGAFNLIGVALPQQPDIDALRRHWLEELGGEKPGDAGRSEERRVGKECVGTCRSRGAREH